MKLLLPSLLFLCFSLAAVAQEEANPGVILLISGKEIPFRSVESTGYDLVYRTAGNKNKLKKIDPERVFSLRYMNGTERVIFQRDTLDPLDFTEAEMRMFIKGEQDGGRLYHNKWNYITGFSAGGVSSFFGFYGLVGPFLYTTVYTAFTPNVQKIRGVDPELIKIPEYREGFEKKARDRKIRNTLVSGFVGFATGIVVLSVINN
jgi:hypothetical protein